MGFYQAPNTDDSDHWTFHAHFFPPLLRQGLKFLVLIFLKFFLKPRKKIGLDSKVYGWFWNGCDASAGSDGGEGGRNAAKFEWSSLFETELTLSTILFILAMIWWFYRLGFFNNWLRILPTLCLSTFTQITAKCRTSPLLWYLALTFSTI